MGTTEYFCKIPRENIFIKKPMFRLNFSHDYDLVETLVYQLKFSQFEVLLYI